MDFLFTFSPVACTNTTFGIVYIPAYAGSAERELLNEF